MTSSQPTMIMTLLAIIIPTVALASPTKLHPIWSGDCCNPSGICMTVKASPKELVLHSDGRGGSVTKTIYGKPLEIKKNYWVYGSISWQKPNKKIDGVLRLEDGREFTCFE